MIKRSPWSGGTDEEYETQHFGFGAQRFKIAVRQLVEDKLTIGIKDLESELEKSLNLNDTDKATLAVSCDKLIRLYCERAGPSMKIIDDEIERIVCVPHNVLLPENEVQIEQVSDSEHERLKEEVVALRKRVERVALFGALLSAEEEELEKVLVQTSETAKKDMEVLDLLQKSNENDCTRAIHCETEFLCASAPIKEKIDMLWDV